MNLSTMTKKEGALLLLADALLGAVKEAGDQGIPSGHLYAMLCGKMSLELYQSIIDVLTEAGRITNKGHLLKAA